jgi:hypothetical protein
MSVWDLWWELTKHIWHRRGRDGVFVAIKWDGLSPSLATGAVTGFTWTDDRDAFCTVEAAGDMPPILAAELIEAAQRRDWGH